MRTETNMKAPRGQRGSSLIIALLALLVLSVLTAGVIFTTQADIWSTANYRNLAQARYAAEAGVQSTINWLQFTYAQPANFASYTMTTAPVTYNGNPVVLSGISSIQSNLPTTDVAQQTSFSNNLSHQGLPGLANASFSTSATLLSMNPVASPPWLGGSGGVMQRWQITSQGTVNGVRSATVQVSATYTRTATPLTTYAAFATGAACAALSLAGGGYTDSYDSGLGAYGGSNVSTTDGNVGTNGNLDMSGNTTIVNGTASFGVGAVTTGGCPANFTGNANAVQGTVALGGPLTFPNPVYTDPSPAITTTSSYSSNVSLPPGNYGNVSVSAGKTLTLSPGTYNFNSLVLSGNATVTVSPPGQVVLEIAGCGNSTCSTTVSEAVDFSGGSIVNSTNDPVNFQIVYNGTAPMNLAGGSSTAAVVYAPNSAITMSGGAPWLGAIIGKIFTDSGGAAVHFDRALLRDLVKVGPYQLMNFNWSKF